MDVAELEDAPDLESGGADAWLAEPPRAGATPAVRSLMVGLRPRGVNMRTPANEKPVEKVCPRIPPNR